MAVTAPKVQTLSQAMAELNPAFAAGRAVIGKKQAAIPAKYDAQRAAINAERGQGFAAINNQATGRGGSFSGIPADEQATYLATKYLPGMQQADYQQNQESLQLEGELADLDKELRTTAINRRDKQVSDLNSWNMQERQLAATAAENERQRQFQAQQNAMERAASAAQRAADQGPSNSSIISTLNNWAKSRWGGDHKLSPNDFKAGYQVAAGLGMDVDTYVAVMQRYVNNSHAKDYAF